MSINLNTKLSIVDYLKSIGQDSSYAARAKLAQQYGISNYTGTAAQNTQLLGILNKPTQTTIQTTQNNQGNQIPNDALVKDIYGGPTIYANYKWGQLGEGTKQMLLEQMQNKPSVSQSTPQTSNILTPQQNPTTSQPSASSNVYTGNQTIDNIISLLKSSNDANGKMFADMIQGFQKGLDTLIQRGTQINPAIQITPETVAAFMTTAQANSDIFTPYATSQIDPYYQSQLAQAKQSFLTSVGYSTQQQTQLEQDLQKQYGQSLKDIGASSAEQGFAQSGLRDKQEIDLAHQTNRQIQQSRQALGQQTTQQAQQFASQYGGANVPQFNIKSAPEAGGGTFTQGQGTQPLYNLSDSVYSGLTGSQQFQEKADISSRASQLEQAFRQNASAQQQRYLTL